MPFLFIGIILAGAAIYFGQSSGGELGNPFKTSLGLPDVDPIDDQSGFTAQFDDAFKDASDSTGVPYALIKAHAKRESNFQSGAYRFESTKKGASFGLMQVLWVKGSNRFKNWGYTDDQIGDGSLLYNAKINAYLGARVIQDNLTRLSLRDAINAYNTGVKESVRIAPGNYVDDVLKNYSKIIGRSVT